MAACTIAEHTVTEHQHGPSCGHESVVHDGHTDYIHDGHRHHEHGDHYDEH
ncbi:zinc transporter permease [Nesterenkonia sp. NBAIMH1]|uniref:zinc transporter permease n=1 Tax=Nesterenkonia sp. NBAIMH1 TaxID=2600320 RepID=UPI0011B622B3|nr:zinc transporter permease [Nesterenkonia sp. NBAIMH1]